MQQVPPVVDLAGCAARQQPQGGRGLRVRGAGGGSCTRRDQHLATSVQSSNMRPATAVEQNCRTWYVQ
jgi:hypothetical protein